QVFFTPGATILWEFWIFKLSVEGLQQAAIIFVRFVLIIFFSTLLTLTTTPLSLADGIESGLAPLKKFKVPVHEIGLMLSMSLRFVPTL
ncbi:CbiQ family ECF transporter T component, partial [Streptococcus suis]